MTHDILSIIKLGIEIFGFYFFIKIILILYLWFFYDRRIKYLRERIINIPKEVSQSFAGRGSTTSGIEPHIQSALSPIENELKIKESGRQLLLDRINLMFLLKSK